MGITRGLLITALFSIVLFVLIPVYVPRPSFIPGFAPPPDMWPRAVSIIGMVLGLMLLVLSFSKKAQAITDPDPEDAGAIRGDTPLSTLLVRFSGSVLAFVLFVATVSLIGFLLSGILLLAAMLMLTGYWRRNKWAALSVAVSLPFVLYLFFSNALNTRFPTGILLRALGV
jgi:hypothetical protein